MIIDSYFFCHPDIIRLQVGQKIGTFMYTFVKYWPIFTDFFHYQNQDKICNITKDPTALQVWNVSVLKATTKTRRFL